MGWGWGGGEAGGSEAALCFVSHSAGPGSATQLPRERNAHRRGVTTRKPTHPKTPPLPRHATSRYELCSDMANGDSAPWLFTVQ